MYIDAAVFLDWVAPKSYFMGIVSMVWHKLCKDLEVSFLGSNSSSVLHLNVLLQLSAILFYVPYNIKVVVSELRELLGYREEQTTCTRNSVFAT